MNLYRDLHATLVVRCNEHIAELKTLGFLDTNAEYFEWDAHAVTAELPSKDLLGLQGISLDDDEQLLTSTCSIVVSTYEDPEINNLRKTVNYLFDSYNLGERFPLKDATTGVATSWVVPSLRSITPVANTMTRAVQMLLLEFKVGVTGR
jgi:hypothetical protein